MNLFNDPMAAAFIPLFLLLGAAWGMYFALSNDTGADRWWVQVLQTLHLAPKEPEPEVPLGTRTQVLDLSDPYGKRAPARPSIDYRPIVERSRSFFRWFGVLMLALSAF